MSILCGPTVLWLVSMNAWLNFDSKMWSFTNLLNKKPTFIRDKCFNHIFNHVDRILYPGIPDISPELTWFHKPFLVTYLWGFYMWTSISVKKKEWINGWSFLQKLSLIQMYLQRLIEKPVKHLRWRLLIRYIPESLAKILFPLMKCWKILEVK